jgi:hypothetical protein
MTPGGLDILSHVFPHNLFEIKNGIGILISFLLMGLN